MPVVSKTHRPIIGDNRFKLVISCNAEGIFSAKLPESWFPALGEKEVTGNTIEAVKNAFSKAEDLVEQASAKTRKVIIYKIDKDISFAKGCAISVCCGVFMETTITNASSTQVTYKQERNDGLPINITKQSHELTYHNGRSGKVIEWTPDRHDFFVRLGLAMESVVDMLNRLKDENVLALVADNPGTPFFLGSGRWVVTSDTYGESVPISAPFDSMTDAIDHRRDLLEAGGDKAAQRNLQIHPYTDPGLPTPNESDEDE